MIAGDWGIAKIALQVIAEQGPGLAFARAREAEDAAYRASVKALGG